MNSPRYWIGIGLLAWMLHACQPIDEIGALVPPTADQNPALPALPVTVAGHTRLLYVQTFGQPGSPVLLFVHGSYTDSRAYRNLCESLASRYFVVLWDQRGCGLSERITEAEFSLAWSVEEIRQVREAYAPGQPVTVIGHSWGGGISTMFAAAYPEAVEQLVLLEPIPLTGSDMQQLFKTIVEFSYVNADWNSVSRQGEMLSLRGHEQLDYRAMMMLRSSLTRNYHCDREHPPEWPVHRVGGQVETFRTRALGSPFAGGFNYDFRAGIDQLQDTVLILGGSCSSLGYAVQLAYTKPHFPHARTAEIPDAGHRMNIEQFERVMTELEAHLHAY
ncbi:MAG: alpha/beta hydrolase [Bacteroidia bacterium]|nr:alpha/beta hydrolase [Bacteroidia bacterium]